MSTKYLKISEFSRLINNTLDQFVGESFFEGEIQEFTVSSNGHLYCSIKDEASSLSIVMWASAARALKFKLEKGVQVKCQGKPSLYPKTGRLQVVISKMELAGEGALALKFEELKKKLSLEGLFDKDRKREIPFIPKAIGIITSAKGAAIHDIMVRLQARMPNIPVYLIDVRVQGDGAAKEIAEALKFFSESGKVDVVICGRGGGSLEDLWCFNEEIVVRAIFASKVPVISAVGHEVDITLSDLVADLRAPTPTAAAEMVVPNRVELSRGLKEIERRLLDHSRWLMPKYQEFDELSSKLERVVSSRVEALKLKSELLKSRLLARSPDRILAMLINKLDNFGHQLNYSLSMQLRAKTVNLDKLSSKLQVDSAKNIILKAQTSISAFDQRLQHSKIVFFKEKQERLNLMLAKLESLNPKAVLSRGFSIVRKGSIPVSSVKQLKKGDSLAVELRDGSVETLVK